MTLSGSIVECWRESNSGDPKYNIYDPFRVFFYDANKAFIGYVNPNYNFFIAPANAAFGRVSTFEGNILRGMSFTKVGYTTAEVGDKPKVDLGVGDLKGATPVDEAFVNVLKPSVLTGLTIGWGGALLATPENTTRRTSDYIEIEPFVQYKAEGFRAADHAFMLFDKNKRYIAAKYGSGPEPTFRAGASVKYVLFNTSDEGLATMRLYKIFEEGVFSISNLLIPASNIIGAQKDDDVLDPIPLINLGDSHSNGFGGYTPWITRIAQALTLDLTNFAVAGVTLVDGLPSQIAKIPLTFNGIITMLMGANDMIAHVEKGKSLGDIETALTKPQNTLDATLFYEAFRKHIITIRDNYPKAQLICFEDIHMRWYDGKMDKLEAFRDGKRRICALESIPFVSMGSASWTKNSVDMPDGLHPNNYRHKILALSILPYMQGIANGKRAFEV